MIENRAWETEFACGHKILDRKPKGPDAECPFCADRLPFRISRALVYRDDLAPSPHGQDVEALAKEIGLLRQWVDDLQSGMYVNCVYCGHRYGPKETTPVSMADALKAHIEECPKHPMSALKAELAALRSRTQEPQGVVEVLDGEWPGGISNGLILPCGICGVHPSIDYTVRDDFWKAVVPKHLRLGVVCIDCLAGLALKYGVSVAENIQRVQWIGNGETLVLKPERVYRYVAALRSRPVEPEPVTWRPIETAPMSDALPWRGKQIQILVATDKGRVFETIRSSLGVANLYGETATHWMPLPVAPREEEKI